MATNTLGGVNATIIAELSIPLLTSTFAPLNAFSTDFSAEVAAKGASVTTRFPSALSATDLTSGYTSQNTTLTAATINLTSFQGITVGFYDYERTRSSKNLLDEFVEPAINAVGKKVFQDLWALVNDTNFPGLTNPNVIGATEFLSTAANFDVSDLIDIAGQLDINLVPRTNRSVLLSPAYYAAIVKGFVDVATSGTDTGRVEAKVPRVAGFDVYLAQDITNNGVNVVGGAFHRTALGMAARAIDIPSEFPGTVETVTIPGLGLPVQFRMWYDPDAGEYKMSVGVLYGVTSYMGTAGSRPAGMKIVSAY